MRYQDPPFFIKAMGLAKKFYTLTNITYFYRFGHKILVLDLRKVIDVYKGIQDSLILAEKMNLNGLYCKIIERLNLNICLVAIKKYSNNNILKSIISHIIINIRYDILKNQNFKFKLNKFYKRFYNN